MLVYYSHNLFTLPLTANGLRIMTPNSSKASNSATQFGKVTSGQESSLKYHIIERAVPHKPQSSLHQLILITPQKKKLKAARGCELWSFKSALRSFKKNRGIRNKVLWSLNHVPLSLVVFYQTLSWSINN